MPLLSRRHDRYAAALSSRLSSPDVRVKPLLAPEHDRWQQKYSRSPSPTVLRSAHSSSPVSEHSSSPVPPADELFTGTILDRSAKAFVCATCSRSFVADETLYPGPSGAESYRCRTCFAQQCSKGDCAACGQAVLGDVPFTRTGDGELFHNVRRS